MPRTAFLSLAASSASSPHKACSWSTDERFRPDPLDTLRRGRHSRVVSVVSFAVDRDECEDPRRRELLAVHEVWERLERVACTDRLVRWTPMALTHSAAVRELLELIAALDRRAPHVQRAGEASIARDAAALKARALKRIEELEREPASIETP